MKHCFIQALHCSGVLTVFNFFFRLRLYLLILSLRGGWVSKRIRGFWQYFCQDSDRICRSCYCSSLQFSSMFWTSILYFACDKAQQWSEMFYWRFKTKSMKCTLETVFVTDCKVLLTNRVWNFLSKKKCLKNCLKM